RGGRRRARARALLRRVPLHARRSRRVDARHRHARDPRRRGGDDAKNHRRGRDYDAGGSRRTGRARDRRRRRHGDLHANSFPAATVKAGMKQLLAAFALLALAAPAVAQETETVTRTIALPAGGTLDLKTFSGRVVITPVDGSQVTINAVRRGSRRQLDRVRLDVYASGSTVDVDNDLEIRVPRRTNLRLTSFSAPIEVNGVDAEEVHAHTFSGRVELRLDKWQEHERIDVKTFSGRVALRVPADAAAHVDFRTFSGHLDSEVPLTLRSTSRRILSAELGAGSGDASLRVNTFSGGIKIQR